MMEKVYERRTVVCKIGKTERKKAAEKKPQKGKQGTKSEACSGQLSFLGQMSLDDMALAEVKAG